MKSQDQVLRISYKEVMAWMVLTFAILLFGVTLSFAQGGPAKEDGKIRIRIEKEENGERVKFDTTFAAKDKERIRDFMLTIDEDFELPPMAPVPPGTPGTDDDNDRVRIQSFHWDDFDKEKMKEAMGKLHAEMKDMEKEFGEMHFEMFTDSAFGDHAYQWMDDEDFNSPAGHERSMRISSGHCIQVDGDNQSAGACVIILGDEADGEYSDMHVVEKRMDGDNGDEIIVIRKSKKRTDDTSKPGSENNERVKTTNEKLVPLQLDYYPNPSDGRFTLKFKLEKKGDATIRIADPAGKDIYSENLKGFKGEYSKQLDLSKESKGTYILTITQDGKSITKKMVVE